LGVRVCPCARTVLVAVWMALRTHTEQRCWEARIWRTVLVAVWMALRTHTEQRGWEACIWTWGSPLLSSRSPVYRVPLPESPPLV
jgi:hypothetical protein